MKNRPVIYAALALGIAGYAVSLRRTAKAQRQFSKDARLDIAAIEAASDVVSLRMRASETRQPLGYWLDELQNEIEFQKIIIRES